MNVLHVGPLAGGIYIGPDSDFLLPKNQSREIQVDNPEDVFGPPIYVGPASGATSVLEPGTYYYVYTDEDDWEV